MRFTLFLVAILAATACTASAHSEEQRVSSEQKQVLDEQLRAALQDAEARLASQPGAVDAYSRRGDLRFFLGEFEKSLADYERMVELQPGLSTSHWRRGIARFYAGKYQQAAEQFESYHSFDDVDRENGIWRFLSQTKAYGLERARKGLLKYKKDDREPFPAIYEMFAGRITPAQALTQVENAAVDDAEKQRQLFYAHLYVGLYQDVLGNREDATQHLKLAAENSWAPAASYGPRYMWHVARVHFGLLTAEKPSGS